MKFLLGDHLGSTRGDRQCQRRLRDRIPLLPWGEVRWSSGSSPTDYQFTGQQNSGLDWVVLLQTPVGMTVRWEGLFRRTRSSPIQVIRQGGLGTY